MTVNDADRTSDLGRPKLDWQEGVGGDGRGGLGRGSSHLKNETLLRAATEDGVLGAGVFSAERTASVTAWRYEIV